MKKKNRVSIFWLTALWALVFLGFRPSSAEDEAGLKMSVDKREVEVGDTLHLSFEYRYAGGGQIVQDPDISTPEHFQIGGSGVTSSTLNVVIENGVTYQIAHNEIILTATSPGEETLGPALLIFQDPQGKKQEVKSNIVAVTVVEKKAFSFFGRKKEPPAPTEEPTNSPSDDVQGLKPLIPENYTLLFIKIAFCLLVLGLIAGFLWRQKNKSKKREAYSPPLSGAGKLREAWKKLSNEDLPSKEFCLGLSVLVRECLEYRWGFPAAERTTGEILREIEKQKLTAGEKEAVEKCLKACDRVLYADGNLTGRESLRNLCSSLLPKTQKT